MKTLFQYGDLVENDYEELESIAAVFEIIMQVHVLLTSNKVMNRVSIP